MAPIPAYSPRKQPQVCMLNYSCHHCCQIFRDPNKLSIHFASGECECVQFTVRELPEDLGYECLVCKENICISNIKMHLWAHNSASVQIPEDATDIMMVVLLNEMRYLVKYEHYLVLQPNDSEYLSACEQSTSADNLDLIPAESPHKEPSKQHMHNYPCHLCRQDFQAPEQRSAHLASNECMGVKFTVRLLPDGRLGWECMVCNHQFYMGDNQMHRWSHHDVGIPEDTTDILVVLEVMYKRYIVKYEQYLGLEANDREYLLALENQGCQNLFEKVANLKKK